ncbi:MAG: hypothetical protein HY912_09365 [Desulfomonile tiedjei]|uniref:Thioesterase domain-containing protein n=1 Tax=Desulfomonile tiedjei TaxID=2358 RepID=A0A9D6Z613_9BACT|nr:hypothetical protein [Desulfomonile tiedjei]
MLIKPNPRSFLTGDDAFLNLNTLEESSGRLDQEMVFETRHEGFIGIPHGGLSMGLCLDSWRRIGSPDYPVDVRFKFGGTGIGIGDTAIFSVETSSPGHEASVSARLTKLGDKTPYLRAEITASAGGNAVLPDRPPMDSRKLPYYRNCFVCGHHRTEAGLQRRFQVHGEAGSWVVTTPWGENADDFDRASQFLIADEELHPAILISIFDENTAWGGFMATRSAGLSVRMEFTLLRPVGSHERLLFVGEPSGIRGNPRSPRFFLAAGKILSMRDPSNPEVIAYGRGEWIILDHYTSQIKSNLLPADDWNWIFGDNGD